MYVKNRVELMGFLGKNPESKSTKKTGRTLAILSLATKTWWTGKDEQRQEKTEWHRVVVIWNLNFPSIGVSANLICTNPVE